MKNKGGGGGRKKQLYQTMRETKNTIRSTDDGNLIDER